MPAANHLRQIDLSRRWHVSPRTLEAWRHKGVGPSFLKIRGRVVYRFDDIVAFEQAGHRAVAGERRS